MASQPVPVPIQFVGKFALLKESIKNHVTVRTEERTIDLASLPLLDTQEARTNTRSVSRPLSGYEVAKMLVGAVSVSASSPEKVVVHFAKFGIVAVMLRHMEGVTRPSRRGAIPDSGNPGSSEDRRSVTVPWTPAKEVRDVGTLTGWTIPIAFPENAVRPSWNGCKVEVTMEVPVEITPLFEGRPDYSFVLREVRASGTQTSTVGWGEVTCMNEEAMLVYQKICLGEDITRDRLEATAPPIDLDRAFGHGQEAMLRFLQPTATWCT
jgi:hypothetical protein